MNHTGFAPVRTMALVPILSASPWLTCCLTTWRPWYWWINGNVSLIWVDRCFGPREGKNMAKNLIRNTWKSFAGDLHEWEWLLVLSTATCCRWGWDGLGLGWGFDDHGFSFRWKRFHRLGRCWRWVISVWKGKGSMSAPPPKKKGQQWCEYIIHHGMKMDILSEFLWLRHPDFLREASPCVEQLASKTAGEDLGEPLLADLYGSLLRMELKGINDFPGQIWAQWFKGSQKVNLLDE